MSRFIVHKSKASLYRTIEESLCGIWIEQRRHISYRWKDVTCKNCLKQKSGVKNEGTTTKPSK